jgi:hypothetical protein
MGWATVESWLNFQQVREIVFFCPPSPPLQNIIWGQENLLFNRHRELFPFWLSGWVVKLTIHLQQMLRLRMLLIPSRHEKGYLYLFITLWNR